MAAGDKGRDGFQSLKAGSKDAQAVEEYYDGWAENYDDTLTAWDYRAAEDAAAALSAKLQTGAAVLDVGCGTGLLGKALSTRLNCRLDGLDISEKSIDIARELGCYRHLQRQDLQVTPLPVGDRVYDAAACVGVMTYIDDAQALLTDLCRAVKSGGLIFFTHRDDLWREEDFDRLMGQLEKRRFWASLQISGPHPYLPGNDDFSDEIRVIHALCQVS